MDDLAERHCRTCAGGAPPLEREAIQFLLNQVNGWSLDPAGGSIARQYAFTDFHETMAFVNAVAWIAHREDHHPELEVSFRACTVRYRTHAVGGLSENDFVSAARVNRLVSG